MRKDRALRLSLELLVECQTQGKSLDEFSVNLSSTGAFLETTNKYHKGEKLNLIFTLPHSADEIQIEGEVVWTRESHSDDRPAGVGIKFNDQSEEKYKKLEEAIQRYNKMIGG